MESGALDGSEEPTILGASATLPGGRKARKDARKQGRSAPDGGPSEGKARGVGTKRTRRGSGSPVKGAAIVAVLIAIFAFMPIIASGFKRTPADRFGIAYSGGPFSGSSFQRVVDPGTGFFFNGFWGHLYLYPAGVAAYSMPNPAPDAGLLEASEVVHPTSDHVPVTVTLTAHYRLNQDELQAFHESLGAQHEAHTDEGWEEMERQVVRSAVSASLQEALAAHDAESLISDPDLIAHIEEEVATRLGERLEATAGGRFLCSPDHRSGAPCGDPAVVIGSVDVPTWAGPNADRASGNAPAEN